MDEQSYKKNLVYKISYKTLVDAKPLRIGFIRVYDGTRYLILFGSEEYNVIYHRIRYLIIQKSGITFVIFYNYGRIKIDSFNSFPLEKPLSQFLIKIKITTTIICP